MDSICATVRELEGAGYIVWERERRADGTLGSTEGLNELIRRHGVKHLAIEDLHMTIGEYEELRGTLPVELVHAGMSIDKLRAYLTPEDRDALGHGIGLLGAAPLALANRTSDTVFQPGNTITFEPGIYQPGKLGCRIEDILWLGENNEKVNLTHFPKDELIVLGK